MTIQKWIKKAFIAAGIVIAAPVLGLGATTTGATNALGFTYNNVEKEIQLFDGLGKYLQQPSERREPATCLGYPASDVVEAGESWDGSDEPEVVVVLGSGAVVAAGGGDDKICVYSEGRAGSHIFGESGNDTVITYAGNNNIDTGEGNDLVYLNGGDESVTAVEGDDHIWGLGATRITAYGGSGNDLILGSPGNDFIVGGGNDDVVLGNAGDDQIVELYGTNYLYGGTGQDTIEGGADYDVCHDFDQSTTFTHCEIILQPPAPPLPEAGA
jgi:Ca2+-binding RTX toxin-like protein